MKKKVYRELHKEDEVVTINTLESKELVINDDFEVTEPKKKIGRKKKND